MRAPVLRTSRLRRDEGRSAGRPAPRAHESLPCQRRRSRRRLPSFSLLILFLSILHDTTMPRVPPQEQHFYALASPASHTLRTGKCEERAFRSRAAQWRRGVHEGGTRCRDVVDEVDTCSTYLLGRR